MELIPIIDKDSFEIKGIAERKWAEQNGLCHLTTLLIPVDIVSKKVAVQIRPKGKTFEGYRDFFGGHVGLDKEYWNTLIGYKLDLSNIICETAIREANEELRTINKYSGYPKLAERKDLKMIGKIGDFEWNAPTNIERSTLFLVKIPIDCDIRPMDDIDGNFIKVSYEFLTLTDLIGKYKTKVWNFADGAERILLKIIDDKDLYDEVINFIEQVDEYPKKYLLCWYDNEDERHSDITIKVQSGQDPISVALDYLTKLKFGYSMPSLFSPTGESVPFPNP